MHVWPNGIELLALLLEAAGVLASEPLSSKSLLSEQRSIGSQLVLAQDIRSSCIGVGARVRAHAQRRSQSGI